MRQSTRLITNTIARFTGTLLNVLLSLVTARWLLDVLGVKDFGLLSLLSATVVMSNSLTGSVSRGATRHMAYELGRGDTLALRRVFNTTLVIFLFMAILAFLVGEVIRPFLFRFVMTIPEGRLGAAVWAYHFTLIHWCLVIAFAPFSAALYAAQQSVLLSCNELVGRANVLIAAGLVPYLPGDPLVLYTFLLTLLAAVGVIGPLVGCWKYCPACRIGWGQFDRREVRRIGNFAGWSMLQNLGTNFCNQGGIVILNSRFNTVVDAAYALAQRGAVCQTMFAGAIVNPISPAMTGYQARQQHEQVEMLVHAVNKFSVLMNALIWVPFALESEEVFRLWLGDYPLRAPLFARLLMATSLVSAFSFGYSVMLEARGQIARVALVWNLPLLVVTALVAGVYALTPASPALLPWAMLATTAVVSLVVCPLFVGPPLGIGVGKWLTEVVRPSFVVLGLAFGAATLTQSLLPEGLLRVVAVTVANTATVCLATWFLGLAHWEKHHFSRLAWAAAVKLSLARQPESLPLEDRMRATSTRPNDETGNLPAPQSK